MQTADIVSLVTQCETVRRVGYVEQFYGAVLECSGPDAFLGEICEVLSPNDLTSVMAEVVGFRQGRVLLMPLGPVSGIHVGSEVVASGMPASVSVSEELLGKVVNAFGKPLDGTSIVTDKVLPLYKAPSNPLKRVPTEEKLSTGIDVIDSFCTMAKGQRMGIFAGSGVGKSTLLGRIANKCDADVNVIALIGERGREVIEFIEDNLGASGFKKSIVIAATADEPALVRLHAAFVATVVAEYFSGLGKEVMLFMDSITRLATAQREIGLAIGEPPTSRGYTPSTFSMLPKLTERAGNFKEGGAITAIYTVLVEGDDFNEPVSDTVRSLLDGHIVLTRQLANQGVYPAIDVLGSLSRLFNKVTDNEHRELIQNIIKYESVYKESKDLIELGAYKKGGDIDIDCAINVHKALIEFIVNDSVGRKIGADIKVSLRRILN